MTGEADFAYFAEGDNAVFKRKEGVVFAQAHLLAGEIAGAALAHNNIARLGALPRIELNPQIFCIGVGKVFSCSACFL